MPARSIPRAAIPSPAQKRALKELRADLRACGVYMSVDHDGQPYALASVRPRKALPQAARSLIETAQFRHDLKVTFIGAASRSAED